MTSHTRIGDITISTDDGIDMNTSVMTGLVTPVDPTDGANKAYVDSVAGLDAVNLGSGEGVFAQDVSGQFQFKTIHEGAAITIGRDVTDVIVSKHLFANPFPEFGIDTTTIAVALSQYGGVLHPNGKIYCVPYNASTAIIIDPRTNIADTTTITGIPVGNFKWSSPVLHPNGNVYAFPDQYTAMFIYNPMTNVLDITSVTFFSGVKWSGTMLAPNGKLYGMPGDTTNIAIYDPNTGILDTTTITFSGVTLVSALFSQGALGPNGKIYCPPANTSRTLIIDTINDVADTTTISTFTGGADRYDGAKLAPNGNIYFIPENETQIMVIDPVTDTATKTIAVPTGTNKWEGSALAADGKIYGMPRSSTRMLIIDTETDVVDTSSISGLSASNNKWRGGVIAPNGKIYMVPKSSGTNVGIVSVGIPKLQPELVYTSHNNRT